MTLPEMIMEIKYLAREGVPKAQIARQCGVSRQTVYNLLERKQLGPHPRPLRASKVDPFKSYIRARLEKFDLPATTLWRELKAQGYSGGITILREFVAPLKADFTRRVTERFETVPGQQAQIDWGECGTVVVGGGAPQALRLRPGARLQSHDVRSFYHLYPAAGVAGLP